MSSLREAFARARSQLVAGQLSPADLDDLWETVVAQELPRRQSLLYLYAMQPTVRAQLVATTVQDPTAGALCQIDPLAPELPYQTVIDAMADGWRVISFPDHRSAYQEGRIDMLGYEFVLEKWLAHVP